MLSEALEDHYRELDRQFLAKLNTATLAELMVMERLEENQRDWRSKALDRAIWRAMLR